MFAGFVVRMENMILQKYVVFRELVGGVASRERRGLEKEWMGYLLDALRVFVLIICQTRGRTAHDDMDKVSQRESGCTASERVGKDQRERSTVDCSILVLVCSSLLLISAVCYQSMAIYFHILGEICFCFLFCFAFIIR